MSFETFFKLSNGSEIPAIAIGSGANRGGVDLSSVTDRVEYVLSLPGVSHIDTAEAYMVDEQISQALSNSRNIRRDKFWLTHKYWVGSSVPLNGIPSKPFYSNPVEAVDAILQRLGLEYIDLYLLHSADITEGRNGFGVCEAWRYMEEAYKSGKAKNIGVSNFTISKLEQIFESCEVIPTVNQIEFHAHLQEDELVQFCKRNNIQVEGYSPLTPLTMSNASPLDMLLEQLLKKYRRTASALLLRWVYQNSILPVTSSSKHERIDEYLTIFSFQLTEEDFDMIKKLGKQLTIRKTPPMIP